MTHQHTGRVLTVRTGQLLECSICGEVLPLRDAVAVCNDPDQRPDGPRVDGMTPHRAAIVEAWGTNR